MCTIFISMLLNRLSNKLCAKFSVYSNYHQILFSCNCFSSLLFTLEGSNGGCGEYHIPLGPARRPLHNDKTLFSRQNVLFQGKTFFLKAKLSSSRQSFGEAVDGWHEYHRRSNPVRLTVLPSSQKINRTPEDICYDLLWDSCHPSLACAR